MIGKKEKHNAKIPISLLNKKHRIKIYQVVFIFLILFI